MTLITPSEELRSTAELICRHTEGTTPGPWKSEATRQHGHRVGTADDSDWVAWTGEHGEDHSARDADWIALMGPAVGKPLALLLEAVASSALESAHEECSSWCSAETCDLSAALAVVRAINGGGRP